MNKLFLVLLVLVAVVAIASAVCPTGSRGVVSCAGIPDGHYQDCYKCGNYVSCGGGIFYRRICPPTVVWDDEKKMCLRSSSTCRVSECPTGNTGVKSCADLKDGYYQDCFKCGRFLHCSGGNVTFIACLFNLVWDDTRKWCVKQSPTCVEQ